MTLLLNQEAVKRKNQQARGHSTLFLNPFPVTHPIHDDRERIKEPVAAGKSQRNERTVWTMKFNAVLMTLDQNTKIRLVVTMYGMKFSSEHYPEYYLDHKESDELLDKVVVDMRVVDNCLEVVLREN